jgi:hypothetical protein
LGNSQGLLALSALQAVLAALLVFEVHLGASFLNCLAPCWLLGLLFLVEVVAKDLSSVLLAA